MSRIGEIHGTANGCAACGHQFGALKQFDAHQDVDYERDPVLICQLPQELGLVQDDNGVWQTEAGLAFRAKQRAAWAGARDASGADGVGAQTGSQCFRVPQ